MKNQLIILSLFLIPIFSCQDNNVIKPDKSVVPTQSPSIISGTPPISVNPTVSPSVSIIPSSSVPSPIVSMSPKMVDQAKIDYPDDYNQEAIPDVIYSNLPIPDKIKNNPSRIYHGGGVVYDRNNHPVPDADITISSPIAKDKFESEYFYSFYYQTKTDSRGFYEFTAYQGIKINIFASKLGFTTRKISITPDPIAEEGGTHDYYFGGVLDSINMNNINQSIYLSINNEPEIKNLVINKQKLYLYNINKAYLEQGRTNEKNIVYKYNSWFYLVNTNTQLVKFKIKSVDKLDIDLFFNKSIDKGSLENNIQIESLDGVDIYDNNTKGIIFNWSDNNSKLNLEIPIKKYNIDKKYRLGFKKPFTDTEGHQAYSGMYISLNSLYSELYSELSENIVFSIASNK